MNFNKLNILNKSGEVPKNSSNNTNHTAKIKIKKINMKISIHGKTNRDSSSKNKSKIDKFNIKKGFKLERLTSNKKNIYINEALGTSRKDNIIENKDNKEMIKKNPIEEKKNENKDEKNMSKNVSKKEDNSKTLTEKEQKKDEKKEVKKEIKKEEKWLLIL